MGSYVVDDQADTLINNVINVTKIHQINEQTSLRLDLCWTCVGGRGKGRCTVQVRHVPSQVPVIYIYVY